MARRAAGARAKRKREAQWPNHPSAAPRRFPTSRRSPPRVSGVPGSCCGNALPPRRSTTRRRRTLRRPPPTPRASPRPHRGPRCPRCEPAVVSRGAVECAVDERVPRCARGVRGQGGGGGGRPLFASLVQAGNPAMMMGANQALAQRLLLGAQIKNAAALNTGKAVPKAVPNGSEAGHERTRGYRVGSGDGGDGTAFTRRCSTTPPGSQRFSTKDELALVPAGHLAVYQQQLYSILRTIL